MIRSRLNAMVEDRIARHFAEVVAPQLAAISERIGAIEARADALEARSRALEAAATSTQEGLKAWTSVVDGILEQNRALRALQREVDGLAGRPALNDDQA